MSAAHFAQQATTSPRNVGRLPRHIDDVPTPRPPPSNDPLPPLAGPSKIGATDDDLVRQGEDDVSTKDVICFAYQNFYDPTTEEFALPSEEEFTGAVVEQLAPDDSQFSYRLKASSLHDTLADPDADIVSVAETLGC